MRELLINRARELRKNSTNAEHYLWYLLRSRRLNRYKFRRQYIIAPYIVDFACLSKKLIIELDGGQHSEAKQYDEKRTKYLNSKGYKVIRFWNNSIFEQTESILNTIYTALENPL